MPPFSSTKETFGSARSWTPKTDHWMCCAYLFLHQNNAWLPNSSSQADNSNSTARAQASQSVAGFADSAPTVQASPWSPRAACALLSVSGRPERLLLCGGLAAAAEVCLGTQVWRFRWKLQMGFKKDQRQWTKMESMIMFLFLNIQFELTTLPFNGHFRTCVP